MNEKMDKKLPWITEWMNEDIVTESFTNTELNIIKTIKEHWNNVDRITLLNDLQKQHGQIVKTVIEKFLKEKTEHDWSEIAKDNKDNTLNSFMDILWKPEGQDGFEYEVIKEKEEYHVKCTRCPMFDLASDLNAHEWIFELACMSDYYMVSGFNSNIVFARDKTLVEGNDYCNHSYREIQAKSL